MSTAVISDVHGNAEALRTVLADIDRRGIKRIICLGDTVGYGPDPLECVDLVKERCVWSLMGNHDFGVLYEPTNFNQSAETAAFWTREQFDNEPDEKLKAARYDFLGRLKVRVVEPPPMDGEATVVGYPAESILAVHGSPRRPINEYIFPDDAVNSPDKLESIFNRIKHICIVGHTHVPGVFTSEPDFYTPSELGENTYKFVKGEKAIINVGSVGQPRDFDPRASYVILYADRATFVRIDYNIDVTAKKIRGIAQLNDWLGDRLFEGR